ncbi:MAG: insulinase family protein [Actinoplanes sp.]
MIQQLEVDGVPALLSPTTGPTHAGLAFRVGFADEPLTRRGITHLVEHLALHHVGVADYHYNGATGVENTFFHMQGEADDIARFLTGVCAALHDLPMHRLATEKDLLQAEANGRSSGPAEDMGLWRHGARDYGMTSYPEWGLPAITADDLRAWVARYFTRDNAVLWVAGDGIPPGLRLNLPGGARQPAPKPSSTLPVTPAYYAGSSGVLVWDTLVPRAARSSVFAGVLERTMFRELRQESGLSYTAQTTYEPVGADLAMITAVADSLPDKQVAVLGAFADVLAALRVGRIDEADVATIVKQRSEATRHAEDQGARLPGQALNLLSGRSVQNVDEVVAELRAVGVAEVAEVAAQACGAGLLMTPRARADWAGFTEAPNTSDAAVAGTAYASLERPEDKFVIGPEGVSLIRGDDIATVRFDACSIVRAWPDGARHFVGHDGIMVVLEPSLFAGAHGALSWLDARIPQALWVGHPARDPSDIPQPETPMPAAQQQPSASGGKALGVLGLIVLIPVTLFLIGFAALLLIAIISDGEEVAGFTILIVILLTLAAGGGIGIHRSARRVYRN